MATINKVTGLILLLSAMLLSGGAQATFHLWQIDELYSDASGAVQYIELATSSNGQEFLSGHTITASQGATVHTFTFPEDLSGDTAGHKFLIGTEAFAKLSIVPPDYVVPNGFLFLANGSFDFAGVDSVGYSALPTDGIHGLDRNGNIIPTTPTNFAGTAGSIVDCLFNWAEKNYAPYLAPPTTSQTASPWYYRHYSANIYLGASTADNHLYYLDATGLHDIGLQSDWLTLAGCL